MEENTYFRCTVCNDFHHGNNPPQICPTYSSIKAYLLVTELEADIALFEKQTGLKYCPCRIPSGDFEKTFKYSVPAISKYRRPGQSKHVAGVGYLLTLDAIRKNKPY